MKRTALIIALVLAVAVSFAQISRAQTARPDLSRLTGVWRGQADGFPAVTLVVTNESGSLSGAVLFYFHVRKTVNDPVTSTPGLPEPMFGMNFDGKMLTFQVSHRHAHPPRTLSDPPVTLTLTLTGPNQAELENKSEKGLVLAMVRSDY
jgi:hypothetical protein